MTTVNKITSTQHKKGSTDYGNKKNNKKTIDKTDKMV